MFILPKWITDIKKLFAAGQGKFLRIKADGTGIEAVAGGSEITLVEASSQEEEDAALAGAVDGSWLMVARTDVAPTGSRPRSRAAWADGIYVGTSAPTLMISFDEWLAGGDGYFGFMDVSSGTATVTVTAAIAPAKATGLSQPLNASFGRYVTDAISPAKGSGASQALEASFSRYVTATLSPATAAASINALVATVTAPGQVNADLAAAQATGMVEALSAAYTRYVAAIISPAEATGTVAPLVADYTRFESGALTSTTATGAVQALAAAYSRYEAGVLGASAAAGSVTPLVASFTTATASYSVTNFDALTTDYILGNASGWAWTPTAASTAATAAIKIDKYHSAGKSVRVTCGMDTDGETYTVGTGGTLDQVISSLAAGTVSAWFFSDEVGGSTVNCTVGTTNLGDQTIPYNVWTQRSWTNAQTGSKDVKITVTPIGTGTSHIWVDDISVPHS